MKRPHYGLSPRVLRGYGLVRRRRARGSVWSGVFGADRVVFATDAPLGPIGETIAKVNRLELSAEDREKIMFGNAKKLLQIEPEGACHNA